MPNDDKKVNQSGSSDELDKPSTTVVSPTPAKSTAEAELSGTSPPPSEPPRRHLFLKRFTHSGNLYLIIFVLLIVLAVGVVFAAIKLGKDDDPGSTKTQSLTDQQLAELQGSTTVVGDSQQVLDIQSSAVFSQPVLMRSNLDVAGTVKVGGPLSLSAVTVGGVSTFGDVQVGGTLTASGTANFQKGLTVVGNGSFSGTLSAANLNVTNFQLTGDLTVTRHIAGGGGTPSRTNGSALGGGGTVSVGGTDTAGTVTINTGSSPPAGCFVTVNFTRSYVSTPHVVISPSNSSAGSLSFYTNRTTGSFSVCTVNVPSASTTYLFDYVVFD